MNQKNLDRYYEAKIASKKADMIVDLEKLIAKAEAAGIQREILQEFRETRKNVIMRYSAHTPFGASTLISKSPEPTGEKS